MSITSLPSDFGIGDLGPSALRFAELLSECKQSYWQVLPVTPTGKGNSPYDSISSFAGNTLLISPEILAADGFLNDLPKISQDHSQASRVNYPDIIALKRKMIGAAYERFKEIGDHSDFQEFCGQNSAWLDDYALYVALRKESDEPWYLWPRKQRDRQSSAMAEKSTKLKDTIDLEKFAQYEFYRQWHSLRDHCTKLGIRLIGDLPFYVAYDSADIWCNREIFKLDKEGKPIVVGGVPPDYFSETGQLWGNPVYDWERLKEERFRWWTDRIQHALGLFDLVRLDHFRGFVAYWEVPSGEKTAIPGKWVPAPCEDFFQTVKSQFDSMPFIAEDLGLITPDVREIMKKFDLAGMKVLLFAFDSGPENPHLPEHHTQSSVAYTGTHDTNTVRGWFRDEATQEQKKRLFEYAGRALSEDEVCREFIHLALNSVASLAIIPTQDVISLGSEARMNQPAFAKGNWEWRATSEQLTSDAFKGLREETESSDS
ncbi:MAG: 4-alpha-glucanotransferase [Thaumarchaeota archaeon]|nr:4-alpha-glucanotransferase [Nitrososphaerota archaeon]